MGEKQRVYMIHGYNANSKSHWFPWLKEQLQNDQFIVDIIDMPDPLNPVKDKWMEQLNHSITEFDEETYFIAHSLGCISLLNYLASQSEDTRIGGLILVSGFSDKLLELPLLDNFVQNPIDYQKIIMMSSNRMVISAADDSIVPSQLSDGLAKYLKADFYRKEIGGHFTKEDGFKTFPLVYDIVKGYSNYQ